MAIIVVPKPLRERLGEEGADALVEVLNQVIGDTRGETLTYVEERFERRLSEEMSKVNQRITDEVSKLHQRITEVEARLDQKISAVQANLIKWMFIFWVGQVGMITAILFAFFRARA